MTPRASQMAKHIRLTFDLRNQIFSLVKSEATPVHIPQPILIPRTNTHVVV